MLNPLIFYVEVGHDSKRNVTECAFPDEFGLVNNSNAQKKQFICVSILA